MIRAVMFALVLALAAGCGRVRFDPTSISEFITQDTTLCGIGFQVYDVVLDVTAASYWTEQAGSCAQQTTPSAAVLYTAALASPDPYPNGSVAPGPVRGRLGYLYWNAPDGSQVPLANWDHQLGRSCFAFLSGDGKLRCLPRRPKLQPGYPDASCTGATKTSLATATASRR